eukprot:20415-Heterococcus_DN1.PRE.4
MQAVAAAAALDPLCNAGVLQQVFTFLPGHHLFLSAVCREWKAAHAGMADQRVHAFPLYDNINLVTCGTRTTLFSAAVASPATARLAYESGVQVGTDKRVQVIAGGHADIQTLAALKELGMPLSESVVEAAALSRRLNILQHLLIEQQRPRPQLLGYYAARSGSISMLNWLEAEGLCVLDFSACSGAAVAGHLAATGLTCR